MNGLPRYLNHFLSLKIFLGSAYHWLLAQSNCGLNYHLAVKTYPPPRPQRQKTLHSIICIVLFVLWVFHFFKATPFLTQRPISYSCQGISFWKLLHYEKTMSSLISQGIKEISQSIFKVMNDEEMILYKLLFIEDAYFVFLFYPIGCLNGNREWKFHFAIC